MSRAQSPIRALQTAIAAALLADADMAALVGTAVYTPPIIPVSVADGAPQIHLGPHIWVSDATSSDGGGTLHFNAMVVATGSDAYLVADDIANAFLAVVNPCPDAFDASPDMVRWRPAGHRLVEIGKSEITAAPGERDGVIVAEVTITTPIQTQPGA